MASALAEFAVRVLHRHATVAGAGVPLTVRFSVPFGQRAADREAGAFDGLGAGLVLDHCGTAGWRRLDIQGWPARARSSRSVPVGSWMDVCRSCEF